MRITNEQLVNGLIPEGLLSRFRDTDTDLNLSGRTSLNALPALPAGIAVLDLSGCTSLTALPALPAGIAVLDLSGCTSLTELPALPAGIAVLYLYGCTSLTALPTLIAQLSALEDNGVEVRYPAHFDLTTQKDTPRSAPSGAAADCVAKVARQSKTCEIL